MENKMSVPKFKRKPSGLEYVDNAFELQKDIMNLASKYRQDNQESIRNQQIEWLVYKQI